MSNAQANAGEPKAPGIGVAAVVWRDETRRELLIGLGHNAGDAQVVYAVPGGHWESGESLAEGVRREIAEEAGVTVALPKFISVYEFYNPEKRKSYITIGFEAVIADGEPTVMEPENKKSWEWHTVDSALELPLFAPDRVLIERSRSGVVFEVVEGGDE